MNHNPTAPDRELAEQGPQTATPPPSLRRELSAIGVLYLLLSILPLLIGLAFAP